MERALGAALETHEVEFGRELAEVMSDADRRV